MSCHGIPHHKSKMFLSARAILFLCILGTISSISSKPSMKVVWPRKLLCGANEVARTRQQMISNNVPDHPEWSYLNAIPWFNFSATQQDQARFHSYLSMAAYGDYRNTCPKTFTKGFWVLEEFSTSIGQTGFSVQVPEMDKIVIVFKGYGNYTDLDWNPASVEDLVSNCTECKVAQGIRDLYLSAKEATNDFALTKKAVAKTGLGFSVTGHGIGGSVAALASLDLGTRDLVHYSHNQGMPRSFNHEAAVRYDNLFQVLAGQSLVHENDFMTQSIPLGVYYHLATKVQISGPKQQWLVNCYANNENSTCLGNGNSMSDHQTYFTPIATCGSTDKGF